MSSTASPLQREQAERSPWLALGHSAGSADELCDQVSSLVERVAVLLDTIDDRADSSTTPIATRINAARDLSAASARLVHAATILQVTAAGLVDQENVALNDHERSTPRWLARHNGITHRQASVLCRSARARDRYGLVDRAFTDGEITLGHLDAIANIIPSRFTGEMLELAIEAVAEIQPVLLETAAKHSVEDFTRFCQRVRDKIDPDGTPARAAEPSRVWLSQTVHGRWELKGDLSADDGALLATMLMDRMARNRRAEKNADTSAPAPADPDSAPEPNRPCGSERRAAALSELVLDGSGSKAPGRVGVFVHIELDDLDKGELPSLAEVLTDPKAPHTEAALDITEDTLWSLLAGADVTPVFRSTGRTLSYGRTHRLPPPILRRILAHRDRRCRVPGCNQPAIVYEAHHVIHWEDDGTTDPGGTCGGCRFHHHDHHDRGLGIEGDAEGELRFTNPDGTPFTAAPAYLERWRERRDEARAAIRERLGLPPVAPFAA